MAAPSFVKQNVEAVSLFPLPEGPKSACAYLDDKFVDRYISWE